MDYRKALLRAKLRRIIQESAHPAVLRRTSGLPTLASILLEDKDDDKLKDVSPEQVTPTQLDKVDPALAKVMIKSGEMDKNKSDDKIEVTKQSWPAASLKPSQTTMRLDNSLGMAFSMLAGDMDLELGCIVSSDNHIMDGHHRWSAAILVDPSSTVSGYGAALPGKELVGVLNMLTKGLFGRTKGNPGKGAIESYTPENVKKALEDAVANGLKGKKTRPPEEIKKLLEDKYGSVEEGIETMSNNVTEMSKDVPGWAPDRVQMPVIEPNEVPKAAKALGSGKVDARPPYAAVVKRAVSGAEKGSDKNESARRGDEILLERWQKLAGIIKG